MRVLLVSTNYLPQLGGVEMVIDHLARNLTIRGYEVSLVTSRSGAGHYGVEMHDGFKVHRVYLGVPGSGWRSSFAFPFLAPATFFSLYRLFETTRPDLVNLHFVDNATAYILPLIRQFNLPLIVSVHGADVERLAKKHAVYRWLMRAAFRKATAVTACSSSLLSSAEIEKFAPGVYSETISNGVDVTAFAEAKPAELGFRYILLISRLVHKKGVDVVIRAFAKLANVFDKVNLLIAGDGPLQGDLEKLAARLELDHRIHFLGRVPHEQIPPLLAGCELFVLGSRKEPFGIVLLEAMAAAKAVVATAVGGVPELITHGQNGMLVPPEDPEALAQMMSSLLRDQQLCRVMGHRGQQFVQKHYTWDRQANQFLDLYQRVLANDLPQ